MSIIEQLRAEHDSYNDIDVSTRSGGMSSIVLTPNNLITFNGFVPAEGDGEPTPVIGAIKTGELVLVEASLLDHKRFNPRDTDDPTKEYWFKNLETVFAAPGAEIGIMENGEFVLLPHLSDPEWNSTMKGALIYGQLQRANFRLTGLGAAHAAGENVENDNLYAFLAQNGFAPVERQAANPNRLWTLSAPKPNRSSHGVACSTVVVTPQGTGPGANPDRPAFRDFVSSALVQYRRVVSGCRPAATEDERALAGTFRNILTGVTEGSREIDGNTVATVNPRRATVGSFTTRTPKMGGYDEHPWNFWTEATDASVEEVREAAK